jgi:hypothetical protein
MFLNTKKRISELMDTVSEMIEVLSKLNDPVSASADCLAAIEATLSQLNQEEIVPQKSIEQLKSIKASFNAFINDFTIINEMSVKLVDKQVLSFKACFQEEVKAKLNVVFFPYKASMWDSLASVYEAAVKDNNCVARVVPIPYYELAKDQAIPKYEGNQFPKNIPVTHYSEYNLEEEQPDIIFVHNIYDQYNAITRVYEEYFTSNLKKYTDMLVYVPYLVSSFIVPKKGDHSLAYTIPTIKNVDKIILAGDFLKEAAIRDGVPEDKLLALGSPKLDGIVNAIREDICYPEGWKDKLEGKTVYLLNTGCMSWSNHVFAQLARLIDFMNIPRFVENSILIWRPHPLTEISIMKYIPYFYNTYCGLTESIRKGDNKFYSGVILDETDDYLPALKVADILISADGSLLRSYLLTEKKVLFLDKDMPKDSLIPPNAFYYFYNDNEPWYELVKKFPKGYDPLAENRRGIASKIYANTDGTCGEKVYQKIKKFILIKKG